MVLVEGGEVPFKCEEMLEGELLIAYTPSLSSSPQSFLWLGMTRLSGRTQRWGL